LLWESGRPGHCRAPAGEDRKGPRPGREAAGGGNRGRRRLWAGDTAQPKQLPFAERGESPNARLLGNGWADEIQGAQVHHELRGGFITPPGPTKPGGFVPDWQL